MLKLRLILALLLTSYVWGQGISSPNQTGPVVKPTAFEPYLSPPYPALAGLWINTNPGVVWVGGNPTTIASQRIQLQPNANNFVYVNLANNTVVSNTTGFGTNIYPIATISTNSKQTITVSDVRPDVYGAGGGGGGSGPAVEVNSVSTSDQTLLNLIDASGIHFANPSGGNVTAIVSGNIIPETVTVSLPSDTGSSNTYAACPTPTNPTLAKGLQIPFIPASTNTGAATFNLCGGGAKAIKKSGATALVAGDVVINAPITLTYDGTQWQDPTPMAIGVTSFTGATGGARTGAVSVLNTDYGSVGILQVGTGTLNIAKTAGGALALGSAANYLKFQSDSSSGVTFLLQDPVGNYFLAGKGNSGEGEIQIGTNGTGGGGDGLGANIWMDSESGEPTIHFNYNNGPSSFFDDYDFSDTQAAFDRPLTVTNAGVFTNTQQNLYVQSLVGGINPTTQWNAIFNLPNHATEAITGGITIPFGATTFQGNGLASYIENQNGATTAGVAVFGMARATTTAQGRVWGGNFLATDIAGVASGSLYSTENDCNVINAASVCHGLLIEGFWNAQPSVTMAIEIGAPQQGSGCTTCTWPMGLRLDTGATKAPDSNNAGVYFNPVAAGNGQVSQGISFLSTLGGGSPSLATLNEDANGNVVIGQSTSGALVTAPIFNSTTGFSLSGNLGTNGQCLLSNGSGSAWGSCATGTVGSVSGTSNQVASTGGATPVLSLFGGVTGGSSPLIFPGNLSALQFANGDDLFTLTRKTDTVPTGNFSKWKTAGGVTIGTLDITGNLSLPAFITNATGAGNQGFAQGSDNCVAQLAFITAQFSVNGICEEAPTSVTAPFYIVKAGTAPAAASVRTYTTASGSPLSTTQSFTPVTGNSAHIQTADATVAGAASGVIATFDGSGNAHSSGININTYLPSIQGPSGGAYTNSANNVASTVMTYSNTIPASTTVLVTCIGSYKFTTAVNTAEFALNFTSAPTNLFLNVEIGGNATTGTHTYGRQTTNGTLVSAGIAAASTGLYLPVTISGGVTTNAATTFTIQGAQVTNAGSSVLNVDQNGFTCSVK